MNKYSVTKVFLSFFIVIAIGGGYLIGYNDGNKDRDPAILETAIAGTNSSEPTEAVKAYFDAWDSHDVDAILDSLTPDGTYSDSSGAENLSGKAYADYANSLFTAFPDLKLELISNTVASNGMVAAPWLLFGTHKGPVGDFQPTNRVITLPGCDFITVENGKVKNVLAYFDPEYLNAQLK